MSWFRPKSASAPNTAVMPVAHPAAPVRQAPATVMERPSPQSIDIQAENIKSVIAAGESFDGNLRLQRGIKIDGYVKGNIEFGLTDGMLVVTHKATVEGNIIGPRAIIVGEVIGNIMIAGRLIILPSAKIHGDIAAGALQMHEGATMNGRICTISEMQNPPPTVDHQDDVPVKAPVPHAPADQTADVLRFVAGR